MKSQWKKILLASAVTLVSMNVSAQQSPEQQAQKKLNRLSRIVQKLESNIYSMDQFQLRKLNNKLTQAIQTLRPGHGPRPGPRPPRPSMKTVTGSIENMTFVYDVTDAMDLAAQCIGQFEGKTNSVDDAKLSVDFSPETKLHTSGWWTSAGEVCTVIAAKSVEMGVFPKSGYGYTAIGSIEKNTFLFKGNSLKDILLQCQSFYDNEVHTSVDDINIFNGTELVKKHTSGWWTNSSEVCNVIIQEIK